MMFDVVLVLEFGRPQSFHVLVESIGIEVHAEPKDGTLHQIDVVRTDSRGPCKPTLNVGVRGPLKSVVQTTASLARPPGAINSVD